MFYLEICLDGWGPDIQHYLPGSVKLVLGAIHLPIPYVAPPFCFTLLCNLLFMISTLLLLQFLSNCHVFGCHISNCYPMVQKTELDPENPFNLKMETNKEEMKEIEEKEWLMMDTWDR